MKKLFFISFFLFSLFAFSQKTLEYLKEDPLFFEYLTNNKYLMDNVNNLKRINEIITDNIINDVEKSEISLCFGFKTFDDLERFLLKQNKIILALNKNYNLETMNEKEIGLILEDKKFDNFYLPKNENSDVEQRVDCAGPCNRTWRNCRGMATGAAIAGHVACTTIDPIGFGVLCHLAVLATQAFAIDECDNQRDVCLNNC